MIKSMMSRLKKERPGTTTEQAKFSNPISDCNSLKVAFFFLINSVIKCLHFNNLSAGRRDSQRIVSSSTQANVKIVEGKIVFLVPWERLKSHTNLKIAEDSLNTDILLAE